MLWLITLICSSFVVCGANLFGGSKLLHVHVLSRHGDRGPVILYPTDPNKKESWPEGLGKLTLHGKRQHYALGKFLRSMYQDFITTNPNEVLVNSSEADRCLRSAASTMASFYTPDERWKIEEDLKWQPIPIHYLPLKQDRFLSFKATCPRVEADQLRNMDLDVQHFYQKYPAKFDEMSTYSGLNLSQGMNALNLEDTLRVEKRHNLSIPDWVDFYWDELEELTSAMYESYTNSPIILRLRTAPLLQEIAQNMEKKINGVTPDLKIQVYLSHDVVLKTVLLALNITNIPTPPYCATILFELHEMADASMAVRLLYLNSTEPLADMGQPRVLTLSDCSEFCSLENFKKLFQHLIPENWEEECQLN